MLVLSWNDNYKFWSEHQVWVTRTYSWRVLDSSVSHYPSLLITTITAPLIYIFAWLLKFFHILLLLSVHQLLCGQGSCLVNLYGELFHMNLPLSCITFSSALRYFLELYREELLLRCVYQLFLFGVQNSSS